jgi:hypothetical protein
MTLNEIIELATEHANRLTDDVQLASTRIEHVRVTARAQEAINLLHYLMHYTGDLDENREDTEGTSGTIHLDG